jgi:hypothetical protein
MTPSIKGSVLPGRLARRSPRAARAGVGGAGETRALAQVP